MTLETSEFANKHLPDVVRLLNDEYKDSFEFIPFTPERVLSQIRRRRISILVAEKNGNVLGLVGMQPEERGEENISWLAVREGPDRGLIESVLVNEVEKNAKSDTISATVDEGSPRINEWINRGYELNPGWLRMSARLAGLKSVTKDAKDIRLRSLRPGEEEDLVGVMNAGFGWQRLRLGSLETWKSEDPPFDEDWVQIAEMNERIVSAVVAKPDTDHVRYLHLQRGYLGPAATLPEFRNRGLASALTIRAMNFLFEKGMNSVRLGTSEENVSSINLLVGLGFHVDSVRKVLRKKMNNA